MTMASGAEAETAATAVRSEPIYLTIYQVLRDHLERGALEPGLILGQASIARAFNVSRIPAGIALARLLSEGLIQTFEGRGYIVPGGEPQRGDLLLRASTCRVRSPFRSSIAGSRSIRKSNMPLPSVLPMAVFC